MRKPTNLWCHKLGRAAKRAGCLSVPHILFAQTIIGDLDMTIQRQQDIIELEITAEFFSNHVLSRGTGWYSPIDYVVGVEVLKREKHFGRVEFRLPK